MVGARRVPWIAAGTATAVLIALAPRYGWHRDELYFVACGSRLAWGYVDQPPLVPFLARIGDEFARGSVVAVRVWPALAIGATIMLAAAIARELGASRRAAATAAVVTATTPLFAGMGHLLSTATIEVLWWTAIVFVIVRMLRTGDTRLWLPAGVLFGLALLTKHSAALLAVALLAGFVVTPGARRLLASPWLVAGVAIAAVAVAPNIAWHAARDWPVLEMMRSLSEESGVEDHLLFVPAQLGQTGLAVWLWLPGLWFVLRSPGAARYRPIAIAYLALAAFFVVTAGKPYYLAGMYPALIAAGAWWWESRERSRAIALPGTVAVAGAVFAVAFALPAAPVEWQRNNPIEDLQVEVGAQLGWEEMADVIADAVRTLPESARDDVVIYTQNYGQAGAIDLYGPSRGLPPAVSPHNNYWWWGPPPESDVAVVVGVPDRWLPRLAFSACTRVHTFGRPEGVLSEEEGTVVHLCLGHERRWQEIWDDLELISA